MSRHWDAPGLVNGWDLVLPPSRPSAQQLSSLAVTISGVDRTLPVGVLGSTPEFRDLLFELQFTNVHVLDCNIAFHDAMTHQRVYASPERFVAGGWLETLPTLCGYFALLLSDLTMGNVPYEDRSDFYSAIEQALLPGGLFCDKVLTHPGPHLGLDEVLAKFSRLPPNWLHVNQFSCEALFCSELLGLLDLVDTTRFYEEISRQTTNRRIEAFVSRAKVITPPGCVWYYGRTWAELAPTYCPSLTRVTTLDDEVGSPYHGRAFHFVLKRY
jgi:hypothetical protein